MSKSARIVGGMILATLLLAASAGEAEARSGECPQRRIPCCDFVAPPPGIAPKPPALGFQVWPSSLSHAPDSVERLASLAPSHLRFGLGPNWRHQAPLRFGMSDAEMDAAVERGFASQPTVGRFITLLNAMKVRSGAQLHLVIWEPPPLPGEPAKPSNRQLGTPQVDLMAAFLVATLRRLDSAGMRLDGVEIANEPDGAWNIRIRPRDYVQLVERVRAHAERRGFALPPIYGPGTSTITALEPYLADGDTARALLSAVDVLSVHAWDDPRRRGPHESLDAILARLAALGSTRQIAITEYAIARPRPEDGSDRAFLKRRAPDSLAETDFFAALTARDLMRFYGRGVGTIIYWEFQDPVWGRASFGLLDPEGGKRPVFETLGTISGALRSQRISQVASTRDGAVSMTLGPGGSRLWVANPEPTAATVMPPVAIAASPGAVLCGPSGAQAAFAIEPDSLLSFAVGSADPPAPAGHNAPGPRE